MRGSGEASWRGLSWVRVASQGRKWGFPLRTCWGAGALGCQAGREPQEALYPRPPRRKPDVLYTCYVLFPGVTVPSPRLPDVSCGDRTRVPGTESLTHLKAFPHGFRAARQLLRMTVCPRMHGAAMTGHWALTPSLDGALQSPDACLLTAETSPLVLPQSLRLRLSVLPACAVCPG